MERVAFIVDRTRAQINCLLNPVSFELRRRAGIATRHADGNPGGLVTGTALADDPLFFTGGGSTELTVNLLFDVSLVDSPNAPHDVRLLTGPLWELAENHRLANAYGGPLLVRFVWGKAWNVPGVIESLAERLEDFSSGGTPQRAWVRLRMLRVADDAADHGGATYAPPVSTAVDGAAVQSPTPSASEVRHVVGPGERLDAIAYTYYGIAALWRLLAQVNDIADPTLLTAGQVLSIPTANDEAAA